MKTIYTRSIVPTETLKRYGVTRKKFTERFTAIAKDINNYLKESHISSSQAQLNLSILGDTLIDYFEDIRRLKEFHTIEHINSIKLVAYMAYWILRRKPIQIFDVTNEMLNLNEKFVTIYICDFLSVDENLLILRNEKGLESFRNSLLYYFTYRVVNAQNIELMLMAFFAGQIYQNKDTDMSDMLPPSDYE